MDDIWLPIKILALLVEALGLFFLFREVWTAHEVETHEANFTRLERISGLIKTGDWEEAYAHLYLYRHPEAKTLKTGRKHAALLGPADCQQYVQAEWQQDDLPAKLEDALDQWHNRTAPAALQRRRRDFWLGVILVTIAMLFQLAEILFESPTHAQGDEAARTGDDEITRTTRLTSVKILRFDSAQASLQYVIEDRQVDLSDALCRIKHDLAKEHVGGVIVVGRYDRRELTHPVRRKFGSNMALAQARADAVGEYLSGNDCGQTLGSAITITSGPRAGAEGATEEALSLDRTVEIYGVTGATGARKE